MGRGLARAGAGSTRPRPAYDKMLTDANMSACTRRNRTDRRAAPKSRSGEGGRRQDLGLQAAVVELITPYRRARSGGRITGRSNRYFGAGCRSPSRSGERGRRG